MLLLLMFLGCLLLLLWLVSFLIFLLCSNPTQPLPSAYGYGGERKNVLLVIAHPDDESMFFTPTLLSLASLGLYRVHVFCLSTGNAEGLGTIRKQELVSACSLLKVPKENVEVLDDPALQDGHNVIWSQNLIQQKLKAAMSKLKIDIMITFDEYGVSGHPNHSAVYRGVCAFLLEAAKHVGDQEKLNIEAWTLVWHEENVAMLMLNQFDCLWSAEVWLRHTTVCVAFVFLMQQSWNTCRNLWGSILCLLDY